MSNGSVLLFRGRKWAICSLASISSNISDFLLCDLLRVEQSTIFGVPAHVFEEKVNESPAGTAIGFDRMFWISRLDKLA